MGDDAADHDGGLSGDEEPDERGRLQGRQCETTARTSQGGRATSAPIVELIRGSFLSN